MSNSIPSHKQYGLNPTLCTCFYCGEETGKIALLGAKYKGEAPTHMCTSLQPCAKCKDKYGDYVLLVEAANVDKLGGRNKPQPTGRWLAIKKECVTIPNKGICCIDAPTFETLAKQAI